MRTIVTIIFCLLFAAYSCSAQQYTVTQIPYQHYPYDSGIVILTQDPLTIQDDVWSDSLSIGFDFSFYGEQYQNLVIGSNGLLSFNTSLAKRHCNWELSLLDSLISEGVFSNSIMFPYHDVDISVSGTILHKVYGSPPNRSFVVSFYNIPYYSCSSTPRFTGQVVLYEGSNDIVMNIEQKDTCSGWNGGRAVMAIVQDSINYQGVPGRYNTAWTCSYESWKFSPYTPVPQNLNRISGRVIADMNKNCNDDSADLPIRNKPIVFHNQSSGAYSYMYTDMQGYFSKLVDTGSYTFTATNIANQFYQPECPASGNINVYFPAYNDSSDSHLFADTVAQYCSALATGVWPFGNGSVNSAIVSCDTGHLKLYCNNVGVADDSVTLLLTIPDSVSIIYSPVPYSYNGANQYLFNFGLLSPGYDSTIFLTIRFGCNSTDSTYCFSLAAQSAYYTVTCLSYNAHSYVCRNVGAPFDPNAIYVAPQISEQATPVKYLETAAQTPLSYTTTFQNTGTAVAHNIKLTIKLSDKINPASIAPRIASAPYNWLILNDTLIFDFIGINLPDSNANEPGSHGYVVFDVLQNSLNVTGDSFAKKVAIYFDNNEAVVTNNATVLLVDSTVTSLQGRVSEQVSLLFPNPATQKVWVSTEGIISLRVYDLSGRLMLQKPINNNRSEIDVSQWPVGVYAVCLSGADTNKTIKLLKN